VTETVKIEPVKGTGLAEDKDAARQLRTRRILPALRRHEEVVLDFSDVRLATQSYIHALISEAVRRYGDQALELLRFEGCDDDVKHVILAVVRYTQAAAVVSASVPNSETATTDKGS
jgi:hypothetical protein